MTDRSSRATAARSRSAKTANAKSANAKSANAGATPEPTGTRTEPGTPASYGKRFFALLIDWILCVLLGSLLAVLTGVFTGSMRGFWAYPVLIVEYGLFLGFFGQTVGMRLARLRCVSVTDGGLIGVPRALLRGLLLCLVIPPLMMGAGGRGWHDRAAGSIVVHA